jgi:hypothetical protein
MYMDPAASEKNPEFKGPPVRAAQLLKYKSTFEMKIASCYTSIAANLQPLWLDSDDFPEAVIIESVISTIPAHV